MEWHQILLETIVNVVVQIVYYRRDIIVLSLPVRVLLDHHVLKSMVLPLIQLRVAVAVQDVLLNRTALNLPIRVHHALLQPVQLPMEWLRILLELIVNAVVQIAYHRWVIIATHLLVPVELYHIAAELMVLHSTVQIASAVLQHAPQPMDWSVTVQHQHVRRAIVEVIPFPT